MKEQQPQANLMATGAPWRTALACAALVACATASAQEVFNETFAGGASTAGFTIAQTAGTCTWAYNNPGGRQINGSGFDADFAIFDSDNCGDEADSAGADLLSPFFDASGPGNFILSFSQQYRDIDGTVAMVEVWDGTNWNEVYNPVGADAGYPNPAVNETINITAAAGGSTAAQLRFHYAGDWRWWWAIDNVNLSVVACAAPGGLAVSAVTTSGGTIGWTDNGSAAYQWVVTTGAIPNGSNTIASGDGSNLSISGLNSGTPYMAWVRADCGDGTFSNWSNGFPFTTGITNDECSGAIALTVNQNHSCANMTPGTVAGATDSGVTNDCGGTPDDDVWYSFTATDTLHRISLENITGSTTDMYMVLWAGTCGNLTMVPNGCSDPESMDVGGLTIGATYYLQVFSWTSTPGQTSAFDVCVGTEPFCQPPPDLAVDSVNSPNAWISWTDNGAMQYQYELRASGAPGSGANGLVQTGTVAGSPLTITGIVPDSLYAVYVRSICSVGDTSEWSEGLVLFDGYCNTIDFTVAVEPICNVTFAGIDHDSPADVDGSPALENFTIFTAFVGQGGSYPITVSGNTNGDYTTYVTAFFDWDQNQTFETAVPIGSFTNTVCGTPITATVNVPADALIGTTRMRVVKNYNSAPEDPCGTYSFGQAEDYSVVVGTVGIAEGGPENEVTVFPNPASTELYINGRAGKPANVQVYDMVGHLVMDQTSTGRLDITPLAPGSYSLQITNLDGSGIAHARFMKQ
ncbi:MAG: T9SS type A sorting domain-containing protein [Bacteroidetes bacterium]|nr:T9SS type A sorting domain-containing protein [Bacteroidota bacterium]